MKTRLAFTMITGTLIYSEWIDSSLDDVNKYVEIFSKVLRKNKIVCINVYGKNITFLSKNICIISVETKE